MPTARTAAAGITGAMFATMFALFVYKLVRRYFFGDAAAWADELCVILFLWIIFFGAAFVVPERQQIAFDLLVRAVPPPGRRALALLRALLVGGLFAAALPTIVGYLGFLMSSRTPVLRLPYGAVHACFGLLAVAVVARSLATAVRAVRPGGDANV